MDQLRRLSEGGIEFHTQAVLCPGINDGDALEETLRALTELPGARSLALVPVGLTGHREGLAPLRPYRAEEARAVIAQANRWRERLLSERGTRFVFPADEFYLIAGVEPPADEEYEDYAQIDDGVGLLRLLETEFDEAWRALPERERMVIQLRYFHGLTQQRVAKVMEVSQVQVSRIEKKALAMLRELMA